VIVNAPNFDNGYLHQIVLFSLQTVQVSMYLAYLFAFNYYQLF